MKGWGKVKDIAEYTGLSPRTIRTLLRRGLKHSRLNTSGAILIKFADVDEYLERFSETSNRVDDLVSRLVKEIIRG